MTVLYGTEFDESQSAVLVHFNYFAILQLILKNALKSKISTSFLVFTFFMSSFFSVVIVQFRDIVRVGPHQELAILLAAC